MKKKRMIISTVFATIFLMLSFAGCGKLLADGSQATTITSTQTQNASLQPSVEQMPTSPPKPTATTIPSPATTPTFTTQLTQLQTKEGYIPPKSLDGIDPMNDKVVSLTFDDGPHKENTPRLLDILKKNNVVATFFMVGKNVKQYPDIVKRVYDEEHEIGSHSYDHPDLMKLSLNQIMVDQYGKANDAIEAVTGFRTLIDRPPYGSMSEEMAKQIGREQILWSVDPEDWKKENRAPDIVYDHVVNGTENGGHVKDGAIILSHDIHASTVDAYERIIPALKEQGYKFVTVTQMIQIAEIRGKNIGYRFGHAPTAEEAMKNLEKK